MNYGTFHNGPITFIAELHDNTSFMTAGDDGKIFIWDSKTSKMVSKLESDAHFTCGEVDKEGRFVILGTKRGTIRIIDVVDIRNPRLILIKKINLEKQVFKMQISQDGTMLAILNKTARRYNILSNN